MEHPFGSIVDCVEAFFPEMVDASLMLTAWAVIKDWKPRPLELEFVVLSERHPDCSQGQFVTRIVDHPNLCFQSPNPHQTLVEACTYINKHMGVNEIEEAFSA